MLRPSQRVLAVGGWGGGGIGRAAVTAGSAVDVNPVRPRRAATRVQRVVPDTAAPTPAGPPQQVIPRPPSESAAARPVLDLDQIGRDLWNRFEKRMRIEQERRGRG